MLLLSSMRKENPDFDQAYLFLSRLSFFDDPQTRTTLFRSLHYLIEQKILTETDFRGLSDPKTELGILVTKLITAIDFGKADESFKNIFFNELEYFFKALKILFVATNGKKIAYYHSYLRALLQVCEENTKEDSSY